jgi:phytoene/squalene synthetase
METHLTSDPALAAAITRAASKQTYYIVRFLVDKALVDDAYRAYAYFRWVDDYLDQEGLPSTEGLAFVRRQQALMDNGYRGEPLADPTAEECLLIDLIRRDTEKNSGLQAYIRNMMAVMAFDATRRGRLVSQRELNDYTHKLAVAVTEALHYFIGRKYASPHDGMRYQAATGAHLAHMLRDAVEDTKAGYYNIPREAVAAHGIGLYDLDSKGYRNWVKMRMRQARACFRSGRDYLAKIENLRCRVAGYAYIRRFEVVLDCIEREDCLLRAEYPERKGLRRSAEMVGWALWMGLNYRQPGGAAGAWPIR